MLYAPAGLYEDFFRTGSSVICNPPVTDTDIDFMIYCKNTKPLINYLVETGWELCGDEEYGNEEDSNFVAYRKDNLNYIITNDTDHYSKFEQATKLATKLNLLDKQQRIDLFHYICEGEVL